MSDELHDLIQQESYADVAETLQFLLEEYSADTAPDVSEVLQWQALLLQRGGKFSRLAQMCQDYVTEHQS